MKKEAFEKAGELMVLYHYLSRGDHVKWREFQGTMIVSLRGGGVDGPSKLNHFINIKEVTDFVYSKHLEELRQSKVCF